MKKFKLHWLDGEITEIKGYTIADAFRRAGYNVGALKALDYLSCDGSFIIEEIEKEEQNDSE